MILDYQNTFCSGQAVTTDAASENTIDLGVGDIGKSQDQAPWVCVRVAEAFTNATSVAIQIQTDDNTSFSSAATLSSTTVLLAALTLNAEVLKMRLPIGCERYVRLYFDVTGTTPDAGKFSAYLAEDVQASF